MKNTFRLRYIFVGLLVTASFVLGLSGNRIHAEASSENSSIEELKEQIQEQITQAKSLGITINESTTTKNISVDQKSAEEAKIMQDYKAKLAELNQIIEKQKENNQSYDRQLDAWFTNFKDGQSWNIDVLRQAFGEDLSKMSLVNPQDNAGENKIKLYKNQGLDAFYTGETFVYTNVFKNIETNRWVALKMTVEHIWQASGTNGYSHGKELASTPMVDPYSKVFTPKPMPTDKVQFTYKDADLELKVDFIDSEDYEKSVASGTPVYTPVTLLPLLYITDIDYMQAVSVNQMVLGADEEHPLILHGGGLAYDAASKLIKSTHNSGDDSNGPNRNYWAVFPLKRTNSFTYTFYNGNRGPTINMALQGLGDLSASVNIDLPTKKYEHFDMPWQELSVEQPTTSDTDSGSGNASSTESSSVPTIESSDNSNSEPTNTESSSQPSTESSTESSIPTITVPSSESSVPTIPETSTESSSEYTGSSSNTLPITGGSTSSTSEDREVKGNSDTISSETSSAASSSESVASTTVTTTTTPVTSQSSRSQSTYVASRSQSSAKSLPKTGTANQQMKWVFGGVICLLLASGLMLNRLGKYYDNRKD